MNNKKRCPKCGEENPPEAVMCWACYTPLSGAGVAAGATAGRTSRTPAQTLDDSDDFNKPTTQPWQIALIAIGLMVALFMVGKNFLPTGNNSDDELITVPISENINRGGARPRSPAVTRSDHKSSPLPVPQKLPFTIAVSPNPNLKVATMAIVPTDPNLSTQEAGGLASFTRNQFTHMKRWNKLYIYVFRDQSSAKQFADYQRESGGAALSTTDYNNLTSLWRSALACYEYNNGKERVYNPINNPTGWWTEGASN